MNKPISYKEGALGLCQKFRDFSLGKSCGHPGKPRNGHRVGSNFKIGGKVEFECNPGYKLIGSKDRICQPNGLWSGSVPVCDNGSM